MSCAPTRKTRKSTFVAKLNRKLARKRDLEAAEALSQAQEATAAGDDYDITPVASEKAADAGPSNEALLVTLFDRSRAISARMKDITLGKRGRRDLLRRWKNLWCKRAVLNLQIRALKEKQCCNASSNSVTQMMVEEPAVPEKAKETPVRKQTTVTDDENAPSVSHSQTLPVRTLKVIRIRGPMASACRVVTLEKLEQIVRAATLTKVVDNRLCIECPVCGHRTFSGHVREHLSNHLRAVDRPFRCPLRICSMSATKLDIIAHHVSARHPNFVGRWERILAPLSEVETTKLRLDVCVRRLLKRRTIEGSGGFAQSFSANPQLLTDCQQPIRQVVVQRPAPGKRHTPVAQHHVVNRADGRPFVLKPRTTQHAKTVTSYVHGKGTNQRPAQSSKLQLDASQKRNIPDITQRVVYRIASQGGVLQRGSPQRSGPPQRQTLRDTYLQWQHAVHHSEELYQPHVSQNTEHQDQQQWQAPDHGERQPQNAELQGVQGGDLPGVSEDSQRSTPAPQQYIGFAPGPNCVPPFALTTPQPSSDSGPESRVAQPAEQHPAVQWHMSPDSFAPWQLDQETQLESDYRQTTYDHGSHHPQHSLQVQMTYELVGNRQQDVFERYEETVLATHEY